MAQTHSLDLERGSSQYASVANTSNEFDITSGTVEAWVKPESLNNSTAIISTSTNVGAGGFHLDWRLDGSVRFLFGAGNQIATAPAGSLKTGIWYHIAATWTTTRKDLYINGKLVASNTNAETLTSGTATLYVGRFGQSDADHGDGLYKDVRVFNDVRSQTEIIADAHTEDVSDANLLAEWNFNNAYTDSSGNGNTLTPSGSPVFSTTIPWTKPAGGAELQALASMVSWWTMDEASGTRVDAHGPNDLTDNNTVGSAAGKWNLAADFEATNTEYLSIADGSQTGLDFSTACSFAGWVNFESLPTSGEQFAFAGKRNGTGDQRSYYWYIVNNAGTYRLGMQTDAEGSSPTDVTSDAISPSTGTWYHVVISYSAGRVNFFFDGVNVGFSNDAETTIFNSTAEFDVGRIADGLFYMDGLEDETSVYNVQLDYGAVLDLYAAGDGIPYSAAAEAATQPRRRMLTGIGS